MTTMAACRMRIVTLRLFMSECLNGIESGGFCGREHSEKDADGGGEAEGHEDGPCGDVGLVEIGLGDLRDAPRDELACADAEETSDAAEHDGFDEELCEDGGAFGADGLAQANLAGTL